MFWVLWDHLAVYLCIHLWVYSPQSVESYEITLPSVCVSICVCIPPKVLSLIRSPCRLSVYPSVCVFPPKYWVLWDHLAVCLCICVCIPPKVLRLMISPCCRSVYPSVCVFSPKYWVLWDHLAVSLCIHLYVYFPLSFEAYEATLLLSLCSHDYFCLVSYAIHIVSKENRRSALPGTSGYTRWYP
jgi:hypothetical protein